MLEIASKAFDSLAAFPVIQGAIAIVIVFAGIAFARKGEKDRKNGGSGSGNVEVPAFIMGGPVHDALTEVRVIAEQGRVTNKLLEAVNHKLEAIDRGQLYVVQLLEELNNDKTTSQSTLPITPKPRR